jgi:hypothetical protein
MEALVRFSSSGAQCDRLASNATRHVAHFFLKVEIAIQRFVTRGIGFVVADVSVER